jgi:hypothetical protein
LVEITNGDEFCITYEEMAEEEKRLNDDRIID